MWDLSSPTRGQGSNPRPLHWKADSLPLDHQGSPTPSFLKSFSWAFTWLMTPFLSLFMSLTIPSLLLWGLLCLSTLLQCCLPPRFSLCPFLLTLHFFFSELIRFGHLNYLFGLIFLLVSNRSFFSCEISIFFIVYNSLLRTTLFPFILRVFTFSSWSMLIIAALKALFYNSIIWVILGLASVFFSLQNWPPCPGCLWQVIWDYNLDFEYYVVILWVLLKISGDSWFWFCFCFSWQSSWLCLHCKLFLILCRQWFRCLFGFQSLCYTLQIYPAHEHLSG